MTSGLIRLAIIAGLAVVGIVVLTQAFPTISPATPVPSPSPAGAAHRGGGGGHHNGNAGSQQTGGGTQPSTTPTPAGPSPQDPSKVNVGVYNGTTTLHLAQDAISQLTKSGYVSPNAPQNAPQQNVTTTTIYYRDEQGKVDAQALAQSFFKAAQIQKLPPSATVPHNVELAIYLGSDYAAAQGH
jgi:hypothetical protein